MQVDIFCNYFIITADSSGWLYGPFDADSSGAGHARHVPQLRTWHDMIGKGEICERQKEPERAANQKKQRCICRTGSKYHTGMTAVAHGSRGTVRHLMTKRRTRHAYALHRARRAPRILRTKRNPRVCPLYRNMMAQPHAAANACVAEHAQRRP